MRFRLSLLLLLAAALVLRAEEEAKPVKTPPRQMRLLTVGEEPPFRQEIRDGVRYQLPAPPGSLPPVALEVSVASSEGKDEASGSLRLRIGSISAPVTVPGGGSPLLFRVPEAGQESEPWHRLQPPESGDFIVVMWRGQKDNTWDKPSSLVIPANLPPGKASMVNVAPGPLAVVYNSERIALPPLRPVMRPLSPDKPIGFQVGLAKGNGLQRLISRSLEQGPGQHSIVVFYRADGEKPRSPLGIEVIRVKAVNP
ncbi:hypothetical protein ACFQY0_15365 [Haloferula chungangensis]|uniref:Uncharacterized protein n=1 Tax=Haloferula chungangensis TaxID=1048331 RepID=A0ABW2LA65_9BACT